MLDQMRKLVSAVRRGKLSWPPDWSISRYGLFAIAAAMLGGGLKAAGTEWPVIKSVPIQILLAAFGVVVVLLGMVKGVRHVIRNLPASSTQHFAGRTRELSALDDHVPDKGIAVVAGLGGVGKTQLALEYARHHASDYDLVWWMDVQDTAAVASKEFGGLARDLDIPEADRKEPEEVVRGVHRWLESHGRWLILFDDAIGHEAVTEFLPPYDGPGRRHVILTSRDHDWPCTTIELKPWSRDESLEFLAPVTNGHRQDAIRLAELLGDLPKALDIAIRHVERAKLPLAEYVRDLEKRAPQLLAEGSHLAKVTATWVPALEAARREAPVAEALMYVCAFLAPSDIPRALIREHLVLPASFARRGGQNSAWLGEAISALRPYALIDATEERLETHRLVQDTARLRLRPTDRKAWVDSTVRMLVAGFPERPEATEAWPVCSDLLPHARAAIGHALELEADPVATAALVELVARYFAARGEYEDAQETVQGALEKLEPALGDDHSWTARLWNQLAVALRERGRLSRARALAERAHEVLAEAVGSDSTEVANVRANLGRIEVEHRRPAEAIAHLREALAIHEGAHGRASVMVAGDLDALAQALLYDGAWQEAGECLRRSAEVYEHIYGPDHPDTRVTRYALATVAGADEPTTKSQTLEGILGSLEAHYGDHPKVAELREALGDEYLRETNLEGAIENYTRAVEGFTRSRGRDHPFVGRTLVGRFAVLAVSGRTDEARQSVEQAFDILERAEVETVTPARLDALQQALTALGTLRGAAEEFTRIVAVLEAACGPSDAAVAVATNQLACELAEIGEYDAARARHEQASESLKAHFGEHHPLVGKCLMDLGNTCQTGGQVPLAVTAFQRALKAFEGSDPYYTRGLDVASAGIRLYGAMAAAKDPNAGAFLDRARSQFEEAVGPKHALMADILMLSGRERSARAPSDAARDFTDAAEIIATTHGGNSPLLGEPLNALGELYLGANQAAKAVELHSQALALHRGAYGELHQDVAADLILVGRAELQAGDLDPARGHLEAAARVASATAGAESALVVSAARFLAAVCIKLGDLATAREQYERIVSINRAAGDAGAASLGTDLRMLFRTMALMGEVDAAERMLTDETLGDPRDRGLALGDGLLFGGRLDDAERIYVRVLEDSAETAGDAHTRLAVVAAVRGTADEAAGHLRAAVRARMDEPRHPYWGVLDDSATILNAIQAPTEARAALQAAVATMKNDEMVRRTMNYVRPDITAALPEGWFAKDSLTLLAGDGQANIIASSEPLDPSIDTDQYASIQGELLNEEGKFPSYQERQFEPIEVFGGRKGMIRTFEWSPPDGVRVTQVQIYYAEGGRGYTATATTPSSEFPPRELLLRETLSSLSLADAQESD
jgi:tetratricopeptide (TPR) repeat protein